MKNQINKTEAERENLKNSISDMKKLVADLENTKKDLKKYVAKLDENLEEIEKRVTELKLQISTKEAQLVETERKLENALKTEETQHDSMASHIKFIYENGSSYYLTMLLNAESIGDLLNKSDYVIDLAS